MTPDYATWLTKQQAADLIGCSTKTVEQFAKDRKIEQALWRREGRGMPLAVYDPSDVARIAAERRGEAVPFVLPAVGNGNGHGASAIAVTARDGLTTLEVQQALASGLAEFAVALRAVAAPTSPSSESSESSQSFQKAFLTLPEASAVTGLTQAYLRKMIRLGTLTAIKDRGWKMRRKDLEAL